MENPLEKKTTKPKKQYQTKPNTPPKSLENNQIIIFKISLFSYIFKGTRKS